MSAALPAFSRFSSPSDRSALPERDRQLQQLFWESPEKSPKNCQKQIISFSLKIAPVDPLSILAAIARSDRTHFYWENPAQEEAILGYGIAKSLVLDSGDRFHKAQQFIQECLDRTARIGDLNLPGSGPYLFCSFSFFENSQSSSLPFAPATVILPSYQIVRKKEDCTFVINLEIDGDLELQDLLKKLQKKIRVLSWLCDRKNNFSQIKEPQTKKITNFKTLYKFKESVASALKSINTDRFQKIVLASALDVISNSAFDIVKSLNNLRQNHPDCCTFSYANGKGQNFIGASPERLMSVRDGQLITDALAGSAPRGKNSSEDNNFANKLLNNKKEKREHQAVTEFILDRLTQLGLKPQRSPQKLLKLSNIQHLWTPIYAKLPSRIHPLEIVAQLHPTPAVAGTPTEIACEQIRQYETFDRALYAAPFGWIDYRSNGEFIVGIRSALIEGNRARLYAGAGIVAGSDPDKEMAELKLKFQALLKALV
jgi:menaquinone-specific isochorismate synthase